MPQTRSGRVGNLAIEASGFVGRRRELHEVKRLLASSRLLTLTGAGGTGKTSLALRVAAGLRRAFADGVWFVDLTELHDPSLLTEEVQDPDVLAFLVAAVLDLPDRGVMSLRGLAEQLSGRTLMLVLDNCEHLLPASAALIDVLLRACPRLRVLATSRETLALTAETIYALSPLPTPDRHHRTSPAEVSRYDSVALFLARAVAVAPGFSLTADNYHAVAEVCHRLDGLPLAIELAAARIRVLSPEQILDRLADRFSLLSREARDAPPRQRTLRACMDWSFDLCAKPQRTLWARASVFAGGFELDAVESICADDRVPEADMVDLVTGLLDQSVLVRADQGSGSGAARYRMLETIRGYGQDKLAQAGEQALMWRRYRDWYLRLVALARSEWIGDRQAYWLARLGSEHTNLRAVVEHCLTQPDGAEDVLRLATTLPLHYWWSRGLFSEGRRWLDRAFVQAAEPSALHARALLINSQLALGQGDADAGARLLDQGEELARRLGAELEIGHAVYLRGLGAMFGNDLPRALDRLKQAISILHSQSEVDVDLRMNMLISLGVTAALSGDQEGADTALREMRSIAEFSHGTFYQAATSWVGAIVAWARGELAHAAAQAVENLRVGSVWARKNPGNLGVGLEVLAWITADQQHHRKAATLLGAADNFFTISGFHMAGQRHFVGPHDTCARHSRNALGDKAFDKAFRHGQTLAQEEVLAVALGEEPPSAPPSPATATPLTRREREVADLIAQGLSNKQIAAALVISQRTAEGHVERIMVKLGLNSRTKVATWVLAQRPSGEED